MSEFTTAFNKLLDFQTHPNWLMIHLTLHPSMTFTPQRGETLENTIL